MEYPNNLLALLCVFAFDLQIVLYQMILPLSL